MNFIRELINSLENFKNKRVIVLGDIMLDHICMEKPIEYLKRPRFL